MDERRPVHVLAPGVARGRHCGFNVPRFAGEAVTRLAEAGCTEAEIASITGHSVKSVGAILDRYLARTKGLASSAIEKLEKSKK